MKIEKNYRLGIDMGATSLGWCMLELDKNNEPCDIIRMGVRIFPDGRDDKSKEPLNVKRRTARSIRRNRERFKRRQQNILRALREAGLMPEDIEESRKLKTLDPYILRVKGLDEKLSLFELGRAIFHLNQRRGFKSNMITDKADNDKSAMKNGMSKLKSRIEENGCRSLGEYLVKINENLSNNEQHLREAIRVRVTGSDKNKEYSLFPTREMIENEFDLLWDKQREFYPEKLKDDAKDRIKSIIFFQRPLKAQPKGKCYFEQNEDRILRSDPFFQKFRILQTVNQLEIIDEYGEVKKLSTEQREILVAYLKKTKKANFKSLRTKLGKKFKQDHVFNLESENRKDIPGDETAALMAKPENFGKQWHDLYIDEQSEIIKMLNGELPGFQEAEDVKDELKKRFILNDEQLENCIYLNLGSGTGSLSEKAIKNILPFLEKGLMYHEACLKAGYKHSDAEIEAEYTNGDLPYYGMIMPNHVIRRDSNTENAESKYGKISNVTVHIALNQLRKLINALSQKYGAPKQIVLELARDLKLNKKQKDTLKKRQNKEKLENDRIAIELEDLGVKNNYNNRLKFKLWEELNENPLNRCCPFCGKTISKSELFTEKFEIEHVLPKSKTFDDRRINKTIAWKKANQDKGERPPFEAFGKSPNGYKWEEILMRAEALPKAKWERFLPDAMEKWKDEGEVIGRMLNDTRYMCRIAREYMCYVSGYRNVWVVPGGMTSKLRYWWGFNKFLSDNKHTKNRADHRHHAIDALVIALTSRSMLQKISHQISISNDRYIENVPIPFTDFSHEKTQEIVDNILVSFKPDHKITFNRKRNNAGGQLHEDTAYGIRQKNEKGNYILHVRKPVSDIKDVKKANKIADPMIRNDVINILKDKVDLSEYFEENNINHLRMILKKDPASLIPIKNDFFNNNTFYVSGNNFCCDVYVPNEGKHPNAWKIEIISMFDAHKKNFTPEWKKLYKHANKKMRLFINDTVVLKIDGKWEVRRVRKMTGNRVYLRKINIAKVEKVNGKDVGDVGEQFPGSALQHAEAFKTGIDIIGRMNPRIPDNDS